jgi:hypothetical protein
VWFRSLILSVAVSSVKENVSLLVAAHDSGVICSERLVFRGKRAHSGNATGGGEACHGALELGIGK